jgi:hypothetical protein
VFKGCRKYRWYEGADILHVKRALRRYPICGEEVVDRSSKELAVDQEFEGNRLVKVKELIDKSRKGISF